MSGKSSRVCPPRLSRRVSAALATHSLTISMLRRSMARCQPGLNCRWPSTITLRIRCFSSASLSSARTISSALRMMPTRSFIDCCSSLCRVYGFSACTPSAGGSNAATAMCAAESTSDSSTFGLLSRDST